MWPQLIIVTLFAAIAQGVAGFGFTLLAVSFYLLILRSTDAVQLVILINLAISVVLVARLWHAVPRRLWALLASFIPARRAATIDPLITMRAN